MRHSTIDVLCFPSGLKKNRMLKSLSILKKMHPDDTNVYASNIIDKYRNRPDNLHSMSLADFASSYVIKKAEDLSIEPDEVKSYTVPVSSIDGVKLNPNIIVLKNELGEMRKHSRPCVIHFHKVSKLKSPEERSSRLLQLYTPRRNESELKQDNQSYEDRYKEIEGNILCNIKKHEPYLDIDYEELQNFNFAQSEEEGNAEFSMINPNFLDLDLEDSDSVSNVPVVSTIIDNFLIPNKNFYEICSQMNEGQQHMFSFIIKYALHCKLTGKK